MEVDCTYVGDLAGYVDELGVGCSGGDRLSIYSGWGVSGSGKKADGCAYAEPDLPDYLASRADPSKTQTRYNYDNTARDGVRYYESKKYFDSKGRPIATKDKVTNYRGGEESWVSDFASAHFPVEIHSHWACDTEFWSEPKFSDMYPSTNPSVLPGEPTIEDVDAADLTSTLTAIPGSSTEFFYRVDYTNKGIKDLRKPVLDVGLDDFEVSSIIATPKDASCSSVYLDQECTLADIPADATVTLTLQVSLRDTSRLDTARILSLGSFQGYSHGARVHPATYHLATTALAVAVPAPTTAVCDLTEGSTEFVNPDITTKLATHCINPYNQEMFASADHGAVTIDGYGTLTYTPVDGYVGDDLITVHSSTPEGVSDPATVAVTVVAPALARSDEYSVTGAVPFTSSVSLLANDTIPATEGWMIQQGQTPPAHGTLALDSRTGVFTYTPDAGFSGTDSFKYRLSGRGGAASSAVTVTLIVGH